MFERFSTNSRRVVVLAQEEARRLRHDYIGTEHELLGLLGVSDAVVDAAIGGRLSRDKARESVEEIVGRGETTPSGHIPFTPRAKKVLELSLREALRLRHRSIQPGHIFLGLLREGEGVGAQVLAQAGVDFDKAKEQIAAALKAEPPAPTAELENAEPDDLVESVLLEVPSESRVRVREVLFEPSPAVADRATALARALGPDDAIAEPLHVLAVLLSPGEGSIAGELAALGVDPVALRRQVLAAL